MRLAVALCITAATVTLTGCTPDTAPRDTFCTEYTAHNQDYTLFLRNVADGDLPEGDYAAFNAYVTQLEHDAPDTTAADLTAAYAAPIRELAPIVEAGGGDYDIDIGSWTDAYNGLIDYCRT